EEGLFAVSAGCVISGRAPAAEALSSSPERLHELQPTAVRQSATAKQKSDVILKLVFNLSRTAPARALTIPAAPFIIWSTSDKSEAV
ncbi:MAG: hypothetical protein R6V10_03450, partial [bacterium]